MVFTAVSAAPFVQGDADDVGTTRTPKSSMKNRNDCDLANPPSWSVLRIDGAPNGLMMVSRIACCKCSEERDLIGTSWTKPVNMSVARRMAMKPASVAGKDGMISTAQAVLGALANSEALNRWPCGVFELNWQWIQFLTISSRILFSFWMLMK